ncbi:MAG: bifunctional adenosylcobinamide kinase/adenosylcobinamide-phosphate guanylyltransferase [Rhizobiaceae bacterium]
MNAGRIILVLGGARSGKSAFAEGLTDQTGLKKAYLATGQVFDDEMRKRIGIHQGRRGPEWALHEEPLELPDCLQRIGLADTAVLVDCLTLWVTNLMMAERSMPEETERLIDALHSLPGTIVLVSNEVGLGIVPENAMARAFRDHAGLLHQAVAAIADEVYFVAAGLPLKMKG